MLGRLVFASLAPLLIAAAPPTTSPPKAPVWSASPSTKIVTEEKTFERDGVKFGGTLHVPNDGTRIPAVVVLHGASSPLRSDVLYDHLKQMLPPLGIAVFSFDRRGTGASGGSPKGNSYEVLADDGIAAAKMLASDSRIDPKRIGFWGLSQGGWLSLLAASRHSPTAFAISLSAPMVTPDVQMNFAVANILHIKGYSQDVIDRAVAARTAVDEFERGKLDRETAQSRVDAVADEPWFDLIYLGKTFKDPHESGWAKEIRHDPLHSLGKVTAPTLIMYGSGDPWVPAATSVERLEKVTAGHGNFEVAVIGGADHRMMTTATPAQQIEPDKFGTQAPDSLEYFARLAAWLQGNVLAQ